MGQIGVNVSRPARDYRANSPRLHARQETESHQTAEALSRVDALLAEAGTSKDRMLQTIVWLKSMDDFDAMNQVWEDWVPEGHAPARACGRADLASDELLVEFTVTAAL